MAAKDIDKQAAARTEQALEVGDSRKAEQGIERDARGRVATVRLDRQVTDPNSPEAVQVPVNTIPADHDTQLGLSGVDEVTNDDIEQLEANSVKIGDKTAESLAVDARSHNPVSPALEALEEARAEYDAAQPSSEEVAEADAERAEREGSSE